MNDEEVLAALRGSLAGATESLADVHLDRSADAIRARARGRRVRRGLTGAGAGGVALGVGLTLALAGGSAGGSAATARSVHVNLDAWSVNTLPDGLVYVDVRELVNPTLLRQTLAQAGVPAVVTFGEFCTGPSGGDDGSLEQVLGKSGADGAPKLTIKPAAIPAGSELSIGIVSVAKEGQAGLDTAFGLVKQGSRLTCRVPKDGPGGKGPGKQGPVVPGSPPGPGPVKTKPIAPGPSPS